MGKIKVIVKRTDEQYGHVANISNTLKNLQKIVEGNIETVKVTPTSVLICNEEGNLLGLERNLQVGVPPFHHTIVGDIVVVGVDGEEFCDCPLDFATWKWLLKEWGECMKLKNKSTNMEIGTMLFDGQYNIYIQRDNVRKLYGIAPTKYKAEEFVRELRRWDEAGGSDA